MPLPRPQARPSLPARPRTLTPAGRLKGCSLCCNSFNRRSAAFFAQQGDLVLEDMEAWGLNKMRTCLLQTRNECTQKCAFVASVIFPCLQDGLILLEGQETDMFHLPVKELVQTKASCSLVLKKILYTPPLSQRSMAAAQLLCDKLRMGGHEEAARVLWLYVASEPLLPP